jgi:hypothetical protein
MSALSFAPDDAPAVPLHAVPKPGLEAWLEAQPPRVRAWAEAAGFEAGAGQVLLVPDEAGRVALAAAGLGSVRDARRERFGLAKARGALPEGVYRLEGALAGEDLEAAALGWLLAGYRFTRYKAGAPPKAQLVAPPGIDRARLEAIAAGEALTRDLINTPASDMGPGELAEAAAELAREFGAAVAVTEDDDLLASNLPMIHAVGRASPRAPRLIDLRWGDAGPRLTLVGKGVCFDTGGLNLKPGGSMGLMKKDMGGAATVLGLARMIMALRLPLRAARADPGGRERGLGRVVPAAGRADLAQGADGRDQQHRCRGAAGARRRADAGFRGRRGSPGVDGDAHRGGAGGGGPRPRPLLHRRRGAGGHPVRKRRARCATRSGACRSGSPTRA